MTPVRLVGIGPGHPALITLQAREAITEADAVRHQDGCAPGLLALARADADVAPLRGAEDIIQAAREGRSVAVLYPGDPYFFSNGAQLALALENAAIDFEVIPGLVAETAATALSGMPLTVNGRATSVQLGHAGSADSVVLRLAPGLWENGVKALIDAGHPTARPAAFIVNPGTPAQRRLVAPLGDLLQVAEERGLDGDALLVVGPGVEMSRLLDTHAQRPLHGRRILLTRARHQAEGFRRELADLGAEVIEVPTIEIRPIMASPQSRDAIRRLSETGLVVFTSANAVEIFFQMLFEVRHDARALAASRVCAIGPETARALEGKGIRPELVAGEYTAEGLAQALGGWDLKGTRVLVPRARMGRDALPALLAERGAEVELLPVYETVCPAASAEALRALFADRGVDAITFTSSSTVVNFVDAFPERRLPPLVKKAHVACMGPVTAETARKLGLTVDIIAREYTTRGLTLAISEALG
ncbi:MAG TPA: uroporphyrinogen-III synthase [Candidatus Dormibacteraeota bacterium]